MCGIFGAFTTGKSLDVGSCYRATEALAHRGPDGQGVALAGHGDRQARFLLNPSEEQTVQTGGAATTLFLGHRRLSIVDLADTAFQPMASADGAVWVVFNGEIYNHAELRAELIAEGWPFRTDHSDTETLVYGWKAWGPEMVHRLRGMFAFAVVDLEQRIACFARDRFGKKPLYISVSPERLVFASEIKALTAGGFTQRRIAPEALRDYLRFGYVPSPSAIYTDITKLRAAERVVVPLDSPDALERKTYWELEYSADRADVDPADWDARFRESFREAVELRLMSDVPLGGFLSGGFDSTAVMRETAALLPEAPKSFTIAFDETEFDEGPYARQAAERYGLDHHVRTVRIDDLRDLLPRLGWLFDEPFADSSALPSLALSRMTREHVTVALSGDGGDELLGGYTRYQWNMKLGRIFDGPVGKLLGGALAPFVSRWPDHVRGKGLVRHFHAGGRERYESMMADEFLLERSELRGGNTFDFGQVWDDRPAELLDKMTGADVKLYIPEDLMVKMDRASMECSLEARSPVLDHRLFELIASTPLRYRFDPKRPKRPIYDALEADLGSSFVRRPKKGFSVPIGRWFRGPMYEEVREELGAKGGIVAELFPEDEALSLLDVHRSGSRDQSARLWKLMMLAQWHVNYGGCL